MTETGKPESAPAPKAAQTSHKGVLITEGSEFTIHGLQISADSKCITVTDQGVTLRQDMTRHWLRIALKHLRLASSAHGQLRKAAAENDEASLQIALQGDFESSIQAIVASAIAIDAFYAAVRRRIAVPDAQVKAWRENRTARWRQICEVLRMGFGLQANDLLDLRSSIKQMMKFRDWAAHSPADQRRAVFHPELSRGVEWRFVAFRQPNAKATVEMAIAIVAKLVRRPEPNYPELVSYCANLAEVTKELVAAWLVEFPTDVEGGNEGGDPE